jgi:adenine phosphoribosyltransferase
VLVLARDSGFKSPFGHSYGGAAMDISQSLALIRPIPDFPKPGILFQDISPLLANPEAFAAVISALSDLGDDIDYVAALDARGFILGSAVALQKKVGFIPIRKAGKLPHATLSRSYSLEYGEDKLEIHQDAMVAGSRVLLVDDVLATGGTLKAAILLIQDLGAVVVSAAVLLEISELAGRDNIAQLDTAPPIFSLSKV